MRLFYGFYNIYFVIFCFFTHLLVQTGFLGFYIINYQVEIFQIFQFFGAFVSWVGFRVLALCIIGYSPVMADR